ncbi:hypothetical protein VNO80_05513 [Phaseolus coccineus]|uniref:Uncharacterized protein n=1 Tax=Phaseolus coccineus TaxID=3886 RepID=A0AAN9NM40_PHACN
MQHILFCFGLDHFQNKTSCLQLVENLTPIMYCTNLNMLKSKAIGAIHLLSSKDALKPIIKDKVQKGIFSPVRTKKSL